MRESAKSDYGLHQAEFMSPKNPKFLREGVSTITGRPLYQLTEESKPIGTFNGKEYGDGIIIVEEQDHGGFFEHGIHKEKVIFKK